MRLTSSCTSGVTPRLGNDERTFIGRWLRSAEKPECISALTARAMARAVPSAGQSFASGNISARYSQMARLSHTVRSLCFSAGTLPEGE